MAKVHCVAVVLETFSEHERSILRGVSSYFERSRSVELHAMPVGRNVVSILRLAVQADGVITWLQNDKQAEILLNARVPIVSVQCFKALPIPNVTDNNEMVAAMAAEHLLAQGFRQFGFFGTQGRKFSLERGEAFERILAARGLACQRCLRGQVDPTRFRWDHHDTLVVRWLRKLPKPVGIFAANDVLGHQLLLNARHAGVRVPDEVAVVGVDNDELVCRLASPPLSSIDIGAERIGFQAAAMMDRLLRGEPLASQNVRVEPARLVVRQSSDVVAVSDPNVAAAMHFIRRNIGRSLGVQDVLKEVPVARRTLEQAFRRALNRSIHEEIAEGRLRQVKQLLVDTDLSIQEINDLCGFSDQSHLAASLKKHTGYTPAVYRRTFRQPR